MPSRVRTDATAGSRVRQDGTDGTHVMSQAQPDGDSGFQWGLGLTYPLAFLLPCEVTFWKRGRGHVRQDGIEGEPVAADGIEGDHLTPAGSG